MTPSAADYIRILPELVLTGFGLLVIVLEPLMHPDQDRRPLGILAFLGALASIVAALIQTAYPGEGFFGMVRVDSFSIFFHLLIGFVVATIILASFEYLSVQRIRAGEYYGLI